MCDKSQKFVAILAIAVLMFALLVGSTHFHTHADENQSHVGIAASTSFETCQSCDCQNHQSKSSSDETQPFDLPNHRQPEPQPCNICKLLAESPIPAAFFQVEDYPQPVFETLCFSVVYSFVEPISTFDSRGPPTV